MSGIVRNLFGNYYLYDTKDYEDLIPKLLCVEKFAVYFSGCASVIGVVAATPPIKGFVPIATRVASIMLPFTVPAAVFVGVLTGSSYIRGKKDDEWNSFNASIAASATISTIRKNPTLFLPSLIMIGLYTNIWKQLKLNNINGMDLEEQKMKRKVGFVEGPYLFNWTFVEERPRKWINADDLKK